MVVVRQFGRFRGGILVARHHRRCGRFVGGFGGLLVVERRQRGGVSCRGPLLVGLGKLGHILDLLFLLGLILAVVCWGYVDLDVDGVRDVA